MAKTKTVTDPLAEAAAKVAAAGDTLREVEESASHWLEQSIRLRGTADPNDREAIREADDARLAAEIAEERIPAARQALAEAAAEHSRLNAEAVARRLAADPALTGEAERLVVATLEAAIFTAEWAALEGLQAVRTRQAEAAREAVAAGLPQTPAGYRPLALMPFTAEGSAIRVWPEGGMIALPGMAFRERRQSPADIIQAVRKGTFSAERDVQEAEVIVNADAVPAEDAASARALLGNLYAAEVRPMGEWDELGVGDGVWAVVSEVIHDGSRVHLEAVIMQRGGDEVTAYQPRYGAPKRYGAVLVEQVTTTADRGAGAVISVDLLDPAAHSGPIDLASVGRAVSAAIAAVDPERWGQPLASLVGHEDFVLHGIAKACDHDRVANVAWFRGRDNAYTREILPLDVVRGALIGLPIAGAGVIVDLRIGDDGMHVIDFGEAVNAENAEGADQE